MQIYNHRNLEHAINLRRYPAKASALQAAFDEKRIARVEKLLATRPVRIPFRFNLPQAAQLSPYQQESPLLPYDVIVTGIIASNTTRRIVLRDPYTDLPFSFAGDKRNLYLRLDDIAGGAAQAERGQKGIFYLPSPITIRADSRLYLDVYKQDATADPEQLNIVFIGHRVLTNSEMDADTRRLVAAAVRKREIPRMILLKQEITFDTAAAGGKVKNVFTPKVTEPLIIRGCRSTMSRSLANVGIEGETDWTIDDTPIWSLASADDSETGAYDYLQRGVFMDANRVLEMSFINSIDGVNIDAQTNEITWICETM